MWHPFLTFAGCWECLQGQRNVTSSSFIILCPHLTDFLVVAEINRKTKIRDRKKKMDGWTVHSALINWMSFASESMQKKLRQCWRHLKPSPAGPSQKGDSTLMPKENASHGGPPDVAHLLSCYKTFMWHLGTASGSLWSNLTHTRHPVTAAIS